MKFTAARIMLVSLVLPVAAVVVESSPQAPATPVLQAAPPAPAVQKEAANPSDVIWDPGVLFRLLGSGFYVSALETGVFFHANTLTVLTTNIAQGLFDLAATDHEQAPLGEPHVQMLPSFSRLEYDFNYISRFRVTAPAEYPVSLKSIAFRVGANLGPGFKVDSFALGSTDYLTYDHVLGFGKRVTDASCGFVVSETQMCVRVVLTEEFVVPAGTSHEFLLSAFVRSPLGKTGLTAGHAVTTVLLADHLPISGALTESFVSVGINSIPQNFIWSDLSHDHHSSSSFDWWNGTYATGLPTVPYTVLR